jgi:hypothetical protein
MKNPETSKRASLNKANPRTSTEIIQDQKAQAIAEKAARGAAKAESTKAVVPAKPPDTRAVALPDHRTDLERHLDEIAPTGVTGRLLKLSKNGEIVTADDGVPIDTDTTFIALVDQVLGGYIKFDPEGVLPPERAQGLIYDGFVPPPRTSLGDNDPDEWPIGVSGGREDPWRYQFAIPLQATGTSELYTFCHIKRERPHQCPTAAVGSLQAATASIPRRISDRATEGSQVHLEEESACWPDTKALVSGCRPLSARQHGQAWHSKY